MVGILRELLKPSLGDGDTLTFWVVIADLESLAGGIMNDVSHVLLAQCTQYAEEELTFRQLVGELLLCWEVLGELRVFHGIFIEVLHLELLVSRDIEADDLFLLEMQLLVGQDVSYEAELGALHRGQERINYINLWMMWQDLPC